LILDS
jgi:hypothetical protein